MTPMAMAVPPVIAKTGKPQEVLSLPLSSLALLHLSDVHPQRAVNWKNTIVPPASLFNPAPAVDSIFKNVYRHAWRHTWRPTCHNGGVLYRRIHRIITPVRLEADADSRVFN